VAVVGFALSSIVANAYTPGSSTGYANTAKKYAIKIGVSTGMNFGKRIRCVQSNQSHRPSFKIRQKMS